MKLLQDKITIAELKQMAEKMFGRLVKAVVDIEQGIMIVDAPMHADEEFVLLREHNSKPEHLWGINLLQEKYPQSDWIEFDSLINIRPSLGNRSRYVHDLEIRNKIINIANKLVKP